ncbi:hypothetical protein BS47DRAFT_1421234 [Hydnum rufescens UP504]|uniref:Uncharacterized protein n=1 Tax=Hydnum rufescens UP504 TaxID=1448309 RepID=A0A9P6AKG8_9AGAM|nr:hypothetical protein BS47DRAFT_1421234 [Hydnum rufescens UP504]
MEAISPAGAITGVLEKDSIILGVEKKVTGELLDLSIAKEGGYGSSPLKPRSPPSDVVARVAGLAADANSLVNYAQQAAHRHLFLFNEDIPVEQLAQRLCDLKQGYTQYRGLHPFGFGRTVMCISVNNDMAQCLKQECKDGLSTEEAITLMIKIMNKTMNSTTLSSGKLEFLIPMLGPMMKQLLVKIYKPEEMETTLGKKGYQSWFT